MNALLAQEFRDVNRCIGSGTNLPIGLLRLDLKDLKRLNHQDNISAEDPTQAFRNLEEIRERNGHSGHATNIVWLQLCRYVFMEVKAPVQVGLERNAVKAYWVPASITLIQMIGFFVMVSMVLDIMLHNHALFQLHYSNR